MSSYGLYDYTFRLVIIGDCAVGKTSFSRMMTNDIVTPIYDATIGVDYGSAIVNIDKDNAKIKCQLWDTAGQETFAPLITSYYKDIAGAIIVFDVSNRRSFERLPFWLKELNRHKNTDLKLPTILIGNKIDMFLKREVLTEEASIFAKKHGLIYEEISVTRNINVLKPLKALCENIYENKDINPGIKDHSTENVELGYKLKNPNAFDKDRYNYDCCLIS